MAVLIFLSATGQGIFSQLSSHLCTVAGIRAKNALQVLLYEKALKLPVGSSAQVKVHRTIQRNTSAENNDCLGMVMDGHADNHETNDIDIGFITNLASEDIINVREYIWNIHYLWSLPLKIGVLIGLLYHQMGVSGVAGALFGTIIIIPLQFLTGKCMSVNNKRILKSQDARLFTSTEAVMSMKTVKLNLLEKWTLNKINLARNKELMYLRRDSFLWSAMSFLASISTVLVTTITVGLYVHLETQNFTAADLFTALALLSQLTVCLSVIPVTIPIFIKGIVSRERLKEFSIDRKYRITVKSNG